MVDNFCKPLGAMFYFQIYVNPLRTSYFHSMIFDIKRNRSDCDSKDCGGFIFILPFMFELLSLGENLGM